MSYEDAVSALGDAIDADHGVTPTPAPQPTEQAVVTPATPEGETQPQQVQPEPSALARDEFGRFMAKTQEPANEPAADTFDGGEFNPDLLPPELQPGWKQLQARFTQRTQELAEQRKALETQAAQFDGIDPVDAREAVELYRNLQNPDYLVQFHDELSQALQGAGLTKAEAEAVAAAQVEQAGGNTTSVNEALSRLKSDPDLAPVADELTQLRQMVEQMNADRERERVQQLEVQRQMAIAGEQIRQEAVLVENGFNDAHLKRVHELSGAFGGNLLQTGDVFRAIRQEAVEDFLAAKAAVDTGVGPVGGTGMTSEIPTDIQDLDQGLQAALEHMRQSGLETLDL